MKKTEEILSEYGIKGELYEGREERMFSSIECVDGKLSAGKMRERAFAQKLGSYKCLTIIDVPLFVEKFKMNKRIDNALYPLLRDNKLVLNENKDGFRLPLSWRSETFQQLSGVKNKYEEEKITKAEIADIQEYLLPGYKIRMLFNEKETMEEIRLRKIEMTDKLEGIIRSLSLLELGRELLTQTIQDIQRAIEHYESENDQKIRGKNK